jgi:hypothetical protein|tara:strand:- start:662 stop:1246 length:585 start_codon:yes stop_codon:yes gene_type:complete
MVRSGSAPHAPKPLEVGVQLKCKYKDEFRVAEVLDRQLVEETGQWEYYVHYEGLNRRMDEWVPLSRFDTAAVAEEGKLTRNTKRKLDHEEHEEEGELDQVTLKEHEEATKVKNVQRILFGPWEMETWCRALVAPVPPSAVARLSFPACALGTSRPSPKTFSISPRRTSRSRSACSTSTSSASKPSFAASSSSVT